MNRKVISITWRLLGGSLLSAVQCWFVLLAESESRGMLCAEPWDEFYAQRDSTCHANTRKAKQKCFVRLVNMQFGLSEPPSFSTTVTLVLF